MNGNLSTRQFSTPQPTVAEITPTRPLRTPPPITEPVKPRHQDIHFGDESSRPLPLGAMTLGSAAQAAAWRKPNRVLPYSVATAGSTFRPDAVQ